LSAAFNAPLAGVLFVLEELHRNFSPLLLACAMGASVAADVVAGYFFGLKPVFDFHAIVPLSPERFPWILLLGALSAFAGDLFKRSLYLAQDAYEKLRLPPVVRPVAALLISIPFGLFLFDVTGGGHHLIVELSRSQAAAGTLAVLLAGKIVLTAVSYGSGAAGGIFLPLLACGALLGELFGNVLAALSLTLGSETLNFMIIGMAAFFTAVARAPVTGALLILEMSGNFNHFAGLTAGCMAAFVVGDLIRSKGVYDALLERLLRRPSCEEPECEAGKVVIEIPVCTGSTLAERLVKEIPWPKGCLAVGVQRGEAELIPDGSTELHPGDLVQVLVRGDRAAEAKEYLLKLGTEAP
jgi:H+/Cl- antiporter ClcA